MGIPEADVEGTTEMVGGSVQGGSASYGLPGNLLHRTGCPSVPGWGRASMVHCVMPGVQSLSEAAEDGGLLSAPARPRGARGVGGATKGRAAGPRLAGVWAGAQGQAGEGGTETLCTGCRDRGGPSAGPRAGGETVAVMSFPRVGKFLGHNDRRCCHLLISHLLPDTLLYF